MLCEINFYVSLAISIKPPWFALVFWIIASRISYCNLSCAAAATAKSLQSCPTLCDPVDSSPLGLPFPSAMHESEKSK